MLNRIYKIKTGNSLIIEATTRTMRKAIEAVNYLQEKAGQEYLVGSCGPHFMVKRIK